MKEKQRKKYLNKIYLNKKMRKARKNVVDN